MLIYTIFFNYLTAILIKYIFFFPKIVIILTRIKQIKDISAKKIKIINIKFIFMHKVF